MPVKDEAALLRDSLPSCYRVRPAEVIICTDKPAPPDCVRVVNEIASRYTNTRTRIIEVEQNPSFRFHQAWVRREGFRVAENDRILTVDVDLIVNANVLKAVALVGRDNVGLASCLTFHSVGGLLGLWRATFEQLLRWLIQRPDLTGLYCVWRPYWLDSEDERIKELENVRDASGPLVLVGEDNFLQHCMAAKHRVVRLPDIGAYCMTPYSIDLSRSQFEQGRYVQFRGTKFHRLLIHSILTARMKQVQGYIYQKHSKRPVPDIDPNGYPYKGRPTQRRTIAEVFRDRLKA
jgi:hypothetical protein